jgi:hypothetical protein
VLALELEREVVGQMTALVVASKQPERIGVPDLQTTGTKRTVVVSNAYRSPSGRLTSILK